jgi:hypothetical protein
MGLWSHSKHRRTSSEAETTTQFVTTISPGVTSKLQAQTSCHLFSVFWGNLMGKYISHLNKQGLKGCTSPLFVDVIKRGVNDKLDFCGKT